MGNSKIIRFDYTKMGVLPLRFISVLFFVIFNLAVPSNQAKLANEGSDGDSQESHLPQMFESILRRGLKQIMENIENARILNWNIIKDTDPDTLVSTNEGIDSFFVDSNLNGDFTESNDDFTETLEEFENIKNWDMIKDSDNLESTKSKVDPFADDLNIYGDCIVNSCMTMVRPGGEEFSFKQGLNKRACIISCVCKDPPKSWRPRKIVFAICCFGILLSILYMFA